MQKQTIFRAIIQFGLFLFILTTHYGLITKMYAGQISPYITGVISFCFSLMTIFILDQYRKLWLITIYALADASGVFIFFWHFNRIDATGAIFYSITTFIIIEGLGLILIKEQKTNKVLEIESRVAESESKVKYLEALLNEIASTHNEIKSTYPDFKSKVEELESKVQENKSRVDDFESISFPIWLHRIKQKNVENRSELETKILMKYESSN